MHRQYIHIGARSIAYLDSAPGAGTSRVAVLIHAFPLAASMWAAQLAAAPAGWRLLAPDLRGFGGSTAGDEGAAPSMDDYADDVVGMLGELGVTSAVIGGLSLGGYVTFAVLRRAPQLARAVFLADTRAGADTLEGRGHRRTMLALLDREGASGIAREMIPKLLGATTTLQRPDLVSNVRRMIIEQAASALRGAILRLMERPDSTPMLGTISVPALVVVGDEDEITPLSEAQRMADAIPHAELVLIPNSGHLSSLECPDVFSAALTAFLARV